MESYIIIKWDASGMHRWPNAPDIYRFLASNHHHIFHFECEIPVARSRQLEFLDVRSKMIQLLEDRYGGDFETLSCEQLANIIGGMVYELFGVTPRKVSVYEDAFVGASIYWRNESDFALAIPERPESYLSDYSGVVVDTKQFK